jgi:hypothetical protein
VAVILIVEAPVLAQSTQIFHEQGNGNRDNYLDTNVNSQFYLPCRRDASLKNENSISKTTMTRASKTIETL